ncbi:MAG: DUF5009 domain-containing protein [Lewinellaceae bacterium]|nr:DUF5009 domain-containing protein [Lewinellaceae bacterium]
MTDPALSKRLLSLDAFRGITIAGMILVNNPGSWSSVYPPLLHAKWHGCTPTDLVFPFFLFIVGVAIPLALSKYRGQPQSALIRKTLLRAAILFGLGVFMAAFPNFGMAQDTPLARKVLHYILLGIFTLALFSRAVCLGQKPQRMEWARRFLYLALASALAMAVTGWGIYDFSHLRIPGVLQRIAIVYAICALLFLRAGWRAQLYLGIGLLFLYWALMALVPVPGGHPPNLEAETNLGAWLDRLILTSNHLWSQSKTWDPEGLLSTLPAIVTGISGMLTGEWLRTQRSAYHKSTGMLAAGALLATLGLAWGLAFPINKQIWTSSYVAYTAGLALLFLGVVYWLIDILNYQRWARPFVVYGTNALFVFILSGFVAKLMYTIGWDTAAGERQTVKGWVYDTLFTPFLSPLNASLAFAITNVLVFLALAWVLYRNRVFIKV